MKTRISLFICIILALVLLAACGQTIATPDDVASNSAGAAYQKITAADGKELLENGATLTLVDVRRADEYETAHIPGAVNIPNESIQSTQLDALPELNKTIVVYCRTGIRSKQAADKLVEIGYTDVRDMGGITDWPYDTITGTEPGVYAIDNNVNDNNVNDNNTKNNTNSADDNNTNGGNSNNDSDNSNSSNKDSTKNVESDGIMSEFTASDLNGNDIDQSIFEEYDLTMVNVWATYCGPCLSEMPELGEIADDYKNKGVRIVGIVNDVLNYDGTISESQLDTARYIVKQTGANFLNIIPSKDLYGLLSQITAVPTTFFVDSCGVQVGSAYLGIKSKTEWNKIILKTLKEVQI